MLSQGGGSADICEEDRDVDFRTAGRKIFASSAADSRVFSRRAESEYPNQFTANTAEWVEADLTSRRTWQVAENPMHRRHGGMSLNQNPAPTLFRGKLNSCHHTPRR